MEEMRKEINYCDEQIIKFLIKRFNIVKKIGDFKKKNNLPIVDKDREKIVYDRVKMLANGEIPDDFIENIYNLIIASAVKIESKL
jgi:chorismate mutase